MRRRIVSSVLSLIVALVGVVAIAASPASADSTFQVAWTGIGIYPKSEPSMEANRVGNALPDGASVSVSCELDGEPVSNGAATTDIWEQLSDGTYLPNAFINTGVDGWTPGVARCGGATTDASDPPATGDTSYPVSGLRVVNDGDVATQLLNHYYDKTGSDVVIDWSFFSSNAGFLDFAYSLPADSYGRSYTASIQDSPDMVLALGSFSVARTSDNCFLVSDTYDFSWKQYPGQWADAKLGAAKVFKVRSSGCI